MRRDEGRRQRSPGEKNNEKGLSWQGESEMVGPAGWERRDEKIQCKPVLSTASHRNPELTAPSKSHSVIVGR